MNTLKTISLIIILIGLGFGVANAGHQRDNRTCNDYIFHYNNMESKRTDAPLYAESKENYGKAIGKRLSGKYAECEAFIEEALRMIRKPYPTE